jgi:prepilin-type processing-associated H-X9-DG protein
MTPKLRWPTLMETGCGLAILLVAFVVLFPVFVRDDHRHGPSCMSNMRQLGLGLLMYAQDYDERLPNSLEWPAVLLPYVRGESLFHCPQDSRWVGDDKKRDLWGQRSYDMLQRRSFQRLPEEKRGPSLIAFYETGDMGIAYRHNEGIHLGFMDGHVKWYAREVAPPLVILKGQLEASNMGGAGY